MPKLFFGWWGGAKATRENPRCYVEYFNTRLETNTHYSASLDFEHTDQRLIHTIASHLAFFVKGSRGISPCYGGFLWKPYQTLIRETLCEAKTKQEVIKLKPFQSKSQSHKNVGFSGFTSFGEAKALSEWTFVFYECEVCQVTFWICALCMHMIITLDLTSLDDFAKSSYVICATRSYFFYVGRVQYFDSVRSSHLAKRGLLCQKRGGNLLACLAQHGKTLKSPRTTRKPCTATLFTCHLARQKTTTRVPNVLVESDYATDLKYVSLAPSATCLLQSL